MGRIWEQRERSVSETEADVSRIWLGHEQDHMCQPDPMPSIVSHSGKGIQPSSSPRDVLSPSSIGSIAWHVCLPSPFLGLLVPHPHYEPNHVCVMPPLVFGEFRRAIHQKRIAILDWEIFDFLLFKCICFYQCREFATGQLELYFDTTLGPKDISNHCVGMPISHKEIEINTSSFPA